MPIAPVGALMDPPSLGGGVGVGTVTDWGVPAFFIIPPIPPIIPPAIMPPVLMEPAVGAAGTTGAGGGGGLENHSHE